MNIIESDFPRIMTLAKLLLVVLLSGLLTGACNQTSLSNNDLRVILIRHGEKPENGDNLSCQGLNRSLQLPDVLYSRFGIPDEIYVPAPGVGKSTKNSRMLETITPFAVKYNLKINTSFDVNAVSSLVQDLKNRSGTVLIVWEHKELPDIAKGIGINSTLKWKSDDYDSIWIIDVKNGIATISAEQENISPLVNCPF